MGALIFVGLDNLTGFGTFSLNVGPLPHVGSPTGTEFLWAIVIGLAAALTATGIFRLASWLRPFVQRRRILLTPLAGLAVGGLAIAFAAGTTHGSSEVLFSGQTALPALVQQAAGYTVGALLLLIICKGLAYAISLSSFRGGPIFPSMFIGAAGGIALSHVGGLPMVAGAAMGVGAMVAGALRMPLTAVLLPSLLFLSDAVALMPVVIVAVVVSYVVAIWIKPAEPARQRRHAEPPLPRPAADARPTGRHGPSALHASRPCSDYSAPVGHVASTVQPWPAAKRSSGCGDARRAGHAPTSDSSPAAWSVLPWARRPEERTHGGAGQRHEPGDDHGRVQPGHECGVAPRRDRVGKLRRWRLRGPGPVPARRWRLRGAGVRSGPEARRAS